MKINIMIALVFVVSLFGAISVLGASRETGLNGSSYMLASDGSGMGESDFMD